MVIGGARFMLAAFRPKLRKKYQAIPHRTQYEKMMALGEIKNNKMINTLMNQACWGDQKLIQLLEK